jgi:hypothetical protein
MQSKNLIYADKVLMDAVEIADAIYLYGPDIILMHNKTEFNRAGVSDVLSQILTSSQYLKKTQLSSAENDFSSFDEYITKLMEKNPSKEQLVKSFKENVSNRKGKIIYIANFIKNVSSKTKSNYTKYLLFSAKQHLIEDKYNLYFY